MDELSPGVFECVALDGLPSKGPTNSDDPPNSFRTRDLWSRHPDPTKSNYWKYLSRLDDRITLVNGEKVLPIPIEGRIRQHELVQDAVVFGFQKSVPGLLLFKHERAADLTDEEFLDTIWLAIEDANSKAETFSRISREVIVVFPHNTRYPQTDKGTFIRAKVYEEFAKDIAEAYEKFENSHLGSLQLNIEELESFLLTKFKDDLKVDLEGPDSDIFAAGVDSLQTTRMWRIIKQELDLGAAAQSLSQNIVFEKGTVKALARHLYFLRTSESGEEGDELEVMRELIDKYSTFESHVASTKTMPEKDTVVRPYQSNAVETDTNKIFHSSSLAQLATLELSSSETYSNVIMYTKYMPLSGRQMSPQHNHACSNPFQPDKSTFHPPSNPNSYASPPTLTNPTSASHRPSSPISSTPSPI